MRIAESIQLKIKKNVEPGMYTSYVITGPEGERYTLDSRMFGGPGWMLHRLGGVGPNAFRGPYSDLDAATWALQQALAGHYNERGE